MKKSINILLALIFLCLFHHASGTSKVTPSGTPSSPFLTGKGAATCDKSLNPIIIEELEVGDFTEGTNLTYKFILPDGFIFSSLDLDDITIIKSANITNVTHSFDGNNAFIFEYDLTGSGSAKDTIKITGLKVRCEVLGSFGHIYRSGGSAVQAGNTTTAPDKQSHGFLDSRVNNAGAIVYDYKYTYKESTNGEYSYFQSTNSSPPIDLITRNSYCQKSYFYFEAPLVTGATYSLYKGNTKLNPNYSYNSGGKKILYYYNNDLGNIDYYIEYIKDNCTYKSDPLPVTMMATPPAYNYNYSKDTSFTQYDDPVALNEYINAPTGSNTTLVGIAGTGINAINNKTTFLFLPGVIKTGTVRPYYIVSNSNTCQAQYSFPKPLIVSDPLAPLPSFIQSSQKPPFCANGKSFTIKFVSPNPADSILTYYYLSKKTGSVGASSNTGLTCPDITIDPIKDNYGSNLLYYSLTFKRTDTAAYSYHYGYIALYPERNPKLVGLPDPKTAKDSVVELCSSNKDTIFIRPNPSNGLLDLYIYDPINNKYDSLPNPLTHFANIPNETTGTNRFFIPQNLFEHSSGSNKNYNVKFKIRYIYPGTPYGQCPDTIIRIIKFAIPVEVTHSITSPGSKPYCYGDSIKAIVSYGGSIIKKNKDRFYWNYGDGLSAESDSLLTMAHFYKVPGKYILRFKTKIDSLPMGYCNNDQLDTIKIGSKPKTDFDITKNFEDVDVNFKSLATTLVPNTSDLSDVINKWSWNFGTINQTTYTDEFDDAIQYKYPVRQRLPFKVIHKVTSGWGCSDSITKYIPIFSIKSPLPDDSYEENFDDLDSANSWYSSGWYKRDTLKSSWENKPAGIKIAENNNEASWITSQYLIDNSTAKNKSSIVTYENNEVSWVESPVFNIEDLELPMVSMDTWVNADNLFDGATLQYTICDSVAFGKETWKTLGVHKKGLNWYNSFTVVSRPGGSLNGWTGIDQEEWNFSAYRLEDIKKELINGKKLIRFRVLFASNPDNTPDKNFYGFAFDNFFIGERNRRVLVEEFCDYSNNEIDLDVPFADPQAIRIQYHVRTHKSDDSINNQNRAEPSARALLYGIGKALPRGVIDGILFNNEERLYVWGPDKFLERSLYISPFEISIIDTVKTNGSLEIKAKVKKTSSRNLPGPFVVQIAIVEKSVTGNFDKDLNSYEVFPNVLRNMLPNAAGNRIIKDFFTPAKEDTTITVTWNPFVKLSSNIMVVVFIQDENTKEVYQSYYVNVSKDGLYVPGSRVGGAINEPTFNEVTLSPNPTSGDLKILFNGILIDDYQCTITDGYGKILQTSTIYKNSNAAILDTYNLSSGLYYVMLEGQGQRIVKKFSLIK
jgi:hypothetical protein